MDVKRQATEPPVPGVFPGGCVVLVPSGVERPVALLQALESRELRTEVASDEPAVMIALSEMSDRRRILVAVEPQRFGHLGELLGAVQTFHSAVLCWQYTGDGVERPRLTTLGPADLASVNGHGSDTVLHGAAMPGEVQNGAPVGQILGRRRPVDSLLVKVPGRPLTAREIVTQQELTMLLGPAPGEAG